MKEDKDGNLILEDGRVIPESKRQRTEVYSRIVGYLRPIEQWNDGKQAEFHDRKTYEVKRQPSQTETRVAVTSK